MSDLDPTSRLYPEEPSPLACKRPVLTVLKGESIGLIVQIENDRTVIGRGAQADIVLKDDVASRTHAEIVRERLDAVEFQLKDLSSTNGTFLNGSAVKSSHQLQDGDKIRIGKHLLKFSLLDEIEVQALLKASPRVRDSRKRTDSEEYLCFPPFHIGPDVDLLYRDETVVPLEPQAVRVLRYLAEHQGRVVSKDELLEAIWPDVFTTDGVLKKAVSQARRALCDDSKAARFIETYHRRGYRFIAAVERRTRQNS